MALFIQKFGGSSLADLNCIARVADIIKKSYEAGDQAVVVVSAMAGETDRLIQLASEISEDPKYSELDALLATGEQVSAALLSLYLNTKGCAARSFSGWQAGIRTDQCHANACVMQIDTRALRETLQQGVIPVVAGFQGVSAKQQITTFGRGGSDITAVALAAALSVDECQIFTDVAGVYTSDPRVVKEAKCLTQITFPEMLELSSLGAKVMQQNAVEYAQQHHVPIRVLSTFAPGAGTLITHLDKQPNQVNVSGIAFDRAQAQLSVMGIRDVKCFTKQLQHQLAQSIDSADMLIASESLVNEFADLSYTVSTAQSREALQMTQQLSQQYGCQQVLLDHDVAKLSLVGLGMSKHAGMAVNVLDTLSQQGIYTRLISSSEIKVSVVIDEDLVETAARVLHSTFLTEY